MKSESGIALVLALLAILLFSALGLALAVTTSTELVIASNYRNAQQTLHAADAAALWALAPLGGATQADWDAILAGTTTSAFVDGAPTGTRTLADGASIDLTRIVNLANCGKQTTCSAADLAGNSTGDRPWGANNPVWRLYACGTLASVLSGADVSVPIYVVVLAGDDPAKNDDAISVRAEAFGPRGSHRIVEVIAARSKTSSAMQVLSWRHVR